MADDADPGMNVPAPPFASADDLASRWHELTDAERAKAETMLADASDKIITDCPNWAQASETTLRRICCAMVKRAMLNEDVAGVTQSTQTANGFTEANSYSNPDGDLYLTKSEKRSLGCGVQRVWSIDLSDGSVNP